MPIGLFIGHTNRLSFLAVTLANIGRAVPSYAVMALLFPLSIAFSVMGPGGDIAYLATFLAMVLLAIPPVVTNTYAGMRGVDGDLLEAARGMGMRGHQVLRSVELPLALAGAPDGDPHRLGPGHRHGHPGRRLRWWRAGPLHRPGAGAPRQRAAVGGAILVAILAIATELLFGVADPAGRATRSRHIDPGRLRGHRPAPGHGSGHPRLRPIRHADRHVSGALIPDRN